MSASDSPNSSERGAAAPLESSAPKEAAGEAARPVAHVAPGARLSPRALTALLITACLIPLIGLTAYAALFGRASDVPLDVAVSVGKEPVQSVAGQGAILADVVVVTNLADYELPNLTVDLNGQYFLHRQSAVLPGERLVFPQQIFATKSNQRWVPGRYALTEVTVTAKLPSGRRGVKIVKLE